MNPLDDLLDAEGTPAEDGIALMTELVGAVTWLRRDAMPGITMWDAYEQALRPGNEAEWSTPDPLGAALRLALSNDGEPIAHVLTHGIRRWLDAMSRCFNEGSGWQSG
jgi:hypothetical protein